MNRKMLVAAMLAGGAGAAMAQSNVKLYGTVEAGVTRRYTANTTEVDSNYNSTSNWGMVGSEDLGNGLKANFQLESDAIKVDDGTANPGFIRQSWVGLSGGFGELMVGRTTTPQNRIMGGFDLNNTADGSSALKTLKLAANGSLGGARQSNQIQYATPTLGGFSARVAYAPAENKTNKNWAQIGATYKAGGLTIGAVVQPHSTSLQLKTDDAKYQTGYAMGVRYKFDSVEVSGLYTRDEMKSVGDGFGVGVAVPLGPWTVGAQYARITKTETKALEGASTIELFGNYALSKRTYLYGALGTADTDARTYSKLTHKNTFGFGIVHKF